MSESPAQARSAAAQRRPAISVIIPVRNERPTLAELHRRLRESLPAGSEIIFVDDGSEDGSDAELAKLSAGDPDCLALRLRRALGKSQALAVGFRRAAGAVVATIDGDLQEPPEDIARLAARLRRGEAEGEGLDIVGGWRRVRRDPPLKVFGSRLFNALVRRLSGVPLRDINCGLKVMRREVMEAIPLEGGYHRFIPLLAHWRGYRVGELEVEHLPRRHGRSRFGGERILHGLIDLAIVLFLERYERRPSRFFLGCGALSFAGGAVISAYLAWLRLSTGSIQSRFPLLAFGALLMVVGVQMVSMGLLAELIALQRRRGSLEPRGADELAAIEIAPRAERRSAEEASGPALAGRAEHHGLG